MSITNVKRRASNWAPLSAEARETIRREPGRWDYVELWDGAAAQMNAFGASRPIPAMLAMMTAPEPDEPPDPAQMSLDL